MHPSAELRAALDAAAGAAEIARSLYRQNLAVRIKEDKSPVTDADEQIRESTPEDEDAES